MLYWSMLFVSALFKAVDIEHRRYILCCYVEIVNMSYRTLKCIFWENCSNVMQSETFEMKKSLLYKRTTI